MSKTVLFTIGVDEKTYINPVFAHTLINNPDSINPLRIKAKVIGEDGYETIQVNSIEIWLDDKDGPLDTPPEQASIIETT